MANNIYYDPSRYRYMPEDKPSGVAAMQDWLSRLDKDQFNQALQKYLEVADTSQGYGSIWKNNPDYAWEQFQKNPVQVATPFWQGTPKGSWWQEHAGLGPSPGKITDWDKLFSTGVTAALALAGGAAGGALLGPTLGAATGAGIGAGATGGFVGGTYNDNPLGGMLEGAAKGGAAGWAGGQIAQGIGNATSGYNPAIADATWSSSATIPSAISTAGQYIGQPLINMATKGITNQVGRAISGTTPTGNIPSGSTTIGNTPQQITQFAPGGAGGSMAGMTLQDLANLITPVTGSLMAGSQRRGMENTYGRAQEFASTPSPDQQFYRTELQKMFTDPSSFYQGAPYQAALGQGEQAVTRALGARGMRGSGNELAELQKYGQGFGWDQMMRQASLFGQLSGVEGDARNRAGVANMMIAGGAAGEQLKGAELAQLTQGTNKLMSGAEGGSGWGTKTMSDLYNKANEWINPSNLFSMGDYGSYVNDPSISYGGDWGPLMGDSGYGDWSSGTFGAGDWGFGTDTSWSDWF